MNRIIVEPAARRDLLSITRYLILNAKNHAAAQKLIDEFDEKSGAYARQPLMGDLRDDLGDRLRSFTFRKWYVAVYRPLADGIDVLRVFDGRSDYGQLPTG